MYLCSYHPRSSAAPIRVKLAEYGVRVGNASIEFGTKPIGVPGSDCMRFQRQFFSLIMIAKRDAGEGEAHLNDTLGKSG